MWWDTDLVAKNVEEYVKKWKIDAIITFDDGGVSGHINHRAVSAGVRFTFFSYNLILIADIMHYQKHLSSRHINLLQYLSYENIQSSSIYLSHYYFPYPDY